MADLKKRNFKSLKIALDESKDGRVRVIPTPDFMLALISCAEALEAMSKMYVNTWDAADSGDLMMMGKDSIDNFEAVHDKAREALAQLERA